MLEGVRVMPARRGMARRRQTRRPRSTASRYAWRHHAPRLASPPVCRRVCYALGGVLGVWWGKCTTAPRGAVLRASAAPAKAKPALQVTAHTLTRHECGRGCRHHVARHTAAANVFVNIRRHRPTTIVARSPSDVDAQHAKVIVQKWRTTIHRYTVHREQCVTPQ